MSNEKPDWRPKLTSVEDPIAEDWWTYAAKDGTPRTDHIRIGRPQQLEDGTDWYCPVQYVAANLQRLTPIYGVGPVDALMNAMGFIRKVYEDIDFQPRGGLPPAGE